MMVVVDNMCHCSDQAELAVRNDGAPSASVPASVVSATPTAAQVRLSLLSDRGSARGGVIDIELIAGKALDRRQMFVEVQRILFPVCRCIMHVSYR